MTLQPQIRAQSNTRTTLIVQHRTNNPHYPVHMENIHFSCTLFVKVQMHPCRYGAIFLL
jgi:hypothetical protein